MLYAIVEVRDGMDGHVSGEMEKGHRGRVSKRFPMKASNQVTGEM
jgi:hypothetical protein